MSDQVGIDSQCFINIIAPKLLDKDNTVFVSDKYKNEYGIPSETVFISASNISSETPKIQHPFVYNNVSRHNQVTFQLDIIDAALSASGLSSQQNLTYTLNTDFNIYKTNHFKTGSFKELQENIKQYNSQTLDSLISKQATSYSSSYLPLTQLTPQIYAGLTPYIKFYRRDFTGKIEDGIRKYKDRIYLFDEHPNNFWATGQTEAAKDNALLYNENIFNAGSGLGCGIKNLSFTFAGTNPVESTRAINVTVELFFQSVEDFMASTVSYGANPQLLISESPKDVTDMTDPDGTKDDIVTTTRNYILLISRPNPSGDFSNPISSFATKLKIGWNFNKDILQTLGASEELIDLLEKMQLNLDLELITHSIDFTENGTITLKVDYFGSFERELKSKDVSIFTKFVNAMSENISGQRLDISLADQKDIIKAYNEYEQKCNITQEIRQNFSSDKIAQIKDNLKKLDQNNAAIQKNIEENILKIFRKSFNVFQLNYLQSSISEILTLTDQYSPITNSYLTEALYILGYQPPQDSSIPQSQTKITSDEDQKIFVYTYGSILQSILALSDIGKMDIICGDIKISDYNVISIADVLISQDLFMTWFSNTVTSKNLQNITLNDLLVGTINNLLVPAINYVCDGKASEYYKDNRNISMTINNNVIYIYSTTSKDAGCPDEQGQTSEFRLIEDMKAKNIIHLFIGNEKGPVKSIKFKRIDIPYNREAKAVSNGFIPLNTLRDVYNADIEMVGNIFFYPGTRLYIHPNWRLGDPSTTNTIANIMGLGGYFIVIKVTSTITNSVWNTTLECVWESSGDAISCGDDNAGACEQLGKNLLVLAPKLSSSAGTTP